MKTAEGRAPEDILRMPTATRVSSYICPVRDCSTWLSPPLTKVQQGRMQAYCLLEVNPCTMLPQRTSNPCICNTYFTLYQNILYQKFCCKKILFPMSPPCFLIALDTASKLMTLLLLPTRIYQQTLSPFPTRRWLDQRTRCLTAIL